MEMRVGGRENGFHAIGKECAVPSGLEESRIGFMDFFHGLEVANVDLVDAGPNDRAFIRHKSAIYSEGSGPFLRLFISWPWDQKDAYHISHGDHGYSMGFSRQTNSISKQGRST